MDVYKLDDELHEGYVAYGCAYYQLRYKADTGHWVFGMRDLSEMFGNHIRSFVLKCKQAFTKTCANLSIICQYANPLLVFG